jgi:hypothetical protein
VCDFTLQGLLASHALPNPQAILAYGLGKTRLFTGAAFWEKMASTRLKTGD